MGNKAKALSLALLATGVTTFAATVSADEVKGSSMYRLYNPNSGEHFYTNNAAEQKGLVRAGWKDEGTGWYAPTSGSPVYRLYNKNAGDHHYTLNQAEKESLVKVGWKFEGIGWYSASDKGEKLYRAYNKNAKAGSHNYTLSTQEQAMLVKAGWKNEGVAWYGMKIMKPVLTGGSDSTVTQGESFDVLKGIQAKDFLGNDLKVSISGTVNMKQSGTYTLTYSAKDSQNQMVTATRKVTVKESPKEVENSSQDIVANDSSKKQQKPVISGVKDVTMNQTTTTFDMKKGITAKDGSGKGLSFQVAGTVNTKKVGTYTLTYSATDSQKQVTTVTRKVTIKKVANPTITGIKESKIEQGASFNSKSGISAKDASGKVLDIVVTGTVDTKKAGTYILTYKASDIFCNTTTATRKVTVTQAPKNQNPVFTGIKDVEVTQSLGDFDEKQGITAKDASGKTIEYTVFGYVSLFTPGEYELTYSVTDSNWNHTEMKRKVTVKEAPESTITGIDPVVITQSNNEFDRRKNVSAQDYTGKKLNVWVTGILLSYEPGTYELAYSTIDDFGRSVEKIRKVTVKPSQAIITGAKDSIINQTTQAFDAYAGVSAKDSSGKASKLEVSGFVDTKKVGVYTLTYKATDEFGNITDLARKVTVKKVTSPVITGVKDTTINQSISFDSKAGISAKDASSKVLDVQVSGAIDTKKAGTYTLTYKATDAFGNTTTVTRKVTVNKVANPTITGVKDTTMNQTVTAFDSKSGVSAKDASGKALDVQVSGAIDTKKVGVYTLTYKATDEFGNITNLARKITVKKVANPTITGMKEMAMNQTLTAFDSKAGISAKDASGKALDVQVSGAIDTKKVGVYTLTYKATDAFGNTTTATRKVTVNKVANPTIAGVKDITMNQSVTAFDSKAGISAKDASGKALDVQVSGAIDTKKVGVYTLTYKATDAFGNTTTATRKITVNKMANPTITGVKDTTMNQTVTAFDSKAGVSAKDASGKMLDVQVSGAIDTKKVGVYTLTYKATDAFGNATTATRKITVNKVANPTIVGVKDVTINKSTGMFDFDKGISAKDASGKALDITMQTNLTKENPKSGTYTVTYMATDTFGNSTSQKQTVMIVNDIKPVFMGVENAKVNITTGSFDVKSGVQATDGDGNVVAFDVTGAVDFTKSGNNELVYHAKDTAGNETTVKRNIEVFANSVEYIEITGSSSMHSNETTQLKAMVYPEDAWNKKLIWTSSNPEVATVNQDGQVQSLKSGFTKITVSSQNIKSKEFIVEIDDKIDVDFKVYGKNGYDKYFDTIHFDLTSLDTRKIHITNIEIWNAEQGYTYITDQDLKNKKIRTEIAPLENYSFEIPNNSFYPYGSLVVFYFETEDGIKLRESDIILR